jgi:roundabout axon guidance receptor 2
VQTLEDIPSAPPGDLNAVTLNLTSGLISWTPPPPQHRNGVLLQYSIKIETNKEKITPFFATWLNNRLLFHHFKEKKIL